MSNRYRKRVEKLKERVETQTLNSEESLDSILSNSVLKNIPKEERMRNLKFLIYLEVRGFVKTRMLKKQIKIYKIKKFDFQKEWNFFLSLGEL